ncbi:MAG: hypothetical protein ACK5O2_08530 [Microthrixaceae bacterium]
MIHDHLDGGSDGGSTETLWAHRDRRVPAVAAAHVLTGLPSAMLEQAARIAFAASAECEALLSTMDSVIRELPSELIGYSQRCIHEVRGPVIWSETVAARGSSFGDEDVFVCSTVRRSYDCMQNRLLCWILQRAGLAVGAVQGPMGVRLEPGERRRIEETAMDARRWRGTPRLRGVTPARPSRREVARLRSARGSEGAAAVLLDALARVEQPFSGPDVVALADHDTLVAHEVLLEELTRSGDGFVLGCSDGSIVSGDVSWRHPANEAVPAEHVWT